MSIGPGACPPGIPVCTELLDRTCAAVELILKTAEELDVRQEAA